MRLHVLLLLALLLLPCSISRHVHHAHGGVVTAHAWGGPERWINVTAATAATAATFVETLATHVSTYLAPSSRHCPPCTMSYSYLHVVPLASFPAFGRESHVHARSDNDDGNDDHDDDHDDLSDDSHWYASRRAAARAARVCDYRVLRYVRYVGSGGTAAQPLDSTSLTGQPVLFLPGNAGSFHQSRSLFTRLYELRCASSNAPTTSTPACVDFDLFSVDVGEEPVSLSGALLWRQAYFVRECLRDLVRLYSTRFARTGMRVGACVPTCVRVQALALALTSHIGSLAQFPGVILVGHSMGGTLAALVRTLPDVPARWIQAIYMLGTPITQPMLANDRPMHHAYRLIHGSFADSSSSSPSSPSSPPHRRRALIPIESVAGGLADHLVEPSLTVAPALTRVSSLATSVDRVQRSVDHRCLAWCYELIQVLAESIVSRALLHAAAFASGPSPLSTSPSRPDVPAIATAFAPSALDALLWSLHPRPPPSVSPASTSSSSSCTTSCRTTTTTHRTVFTFADLSPPLAALAHGSSDSTHTLTIALPHCRAALVMLSASPSSAQLLAFHVNDIAFVSLLANVSLSGRFVSVAQHNGIGRVLFVASDDQEDRVDASSTCQLVVTFASGSVLRATESESHDAPHAAALAVALPLCCGRLSATRIDETATSPRVAHSLLALPPHVDRFVDVHVEHHRSRVLAQLCTTSTLNDCTTWLVDAACDANDTTTRTIHLPRMRTARHASLLLVELPQRFIVPPGVGSGSTTNATPLHARVTLHIVASLVRNLYLTWTSAVHLAGTAALVLAFALERADTSTRHRTVVALVSILLVAALGDTSSDATSRQVCAIDPLSLAAVRTALYENVLALVSASSSSSSPVLSPLGALLISVSERSFAVALLFALLLALFRLLVWLLSHVFAVPRRVRQLCERCTVFASRVVLRRAERKPTADSAPSEFIAVPTAATAVSDDSQCARSGLTVRPRQRCVAGVNGIARVVCALLCASVSLSALFTMAAPSFVRRRLGESLDVVVGSLVHVPALLAVLVLFAALFVASCCVGVAAGDSERRRRAATYCVVALGAAVSEAPSLVSSLLLLATRSAPSPSSPLSSSSASIWIDAIESVLLGATRGELSLPSSSSAAAASWRPPMMIAFPFAIVGVTDEIAALLVLLSVLLLLIVGGRVSSSRSVATARDHRCRRLRWNLTIVLAIVVATTATTCVERVIRARPTAAHLAVLLSLPDLIDLSCSCFRDL